MQMQIKVDDSISLQLLKPEHAKEIYNLATQNSAHLCEFLPWIDHANSVEFFDNFIADSLAKHEQNVEIPLVILNNDTIIGRIGIYNIDYKHKTGEIGYWISAEFQGRGIIANSSKSILNYAFQTTDLNRIEIKCSVQNVRSNAIPERLGFLHEGILRQAGFVRGAFHDINLYAICKNDVIIK